MRAAPAFQVSLQRFGVWNGAVTLICGLGLTVIAAWLVARETPLASAASASALITALVLMTIAASLTRTPAFDLRWDGHAWHLGPATGEPVGGDLSVAIDLGPWMLLRFAPASHAVRSHVAWLPVQRRGLESQWHALRCTVYSPRPAPADEPPVAF